ncbi:MAG: FG-GAP-like repeat-containing protein [Deltaproteobacteria bacterium]|nr:FG-GAP-like repeat-containing protein [Deltaproteobacteria bacterium]
MQTCYGPDGAIFEGGTRDASFDAAETSGDVAGCETGQAQCGMSCANLQTDPRNCGRCERACPVVLGGTESCNAGMCEVTCNPGRHLCDGQCRADDSPASCGTSCVACPTAPVGGIATCTMGMCGVACAPGYERVGSACELRIPRQIAPMSTSTVTSQRPTLRWEPAMELTMARVELCRDRAMTAMCQSMTVAANRAQPAAALAPGLWYWRLRGVQAGTEGSRTSPVWQFRVGFRSAPVDTSWGTEPDFNGDGFGDVAVGASNVAPGGRMGAGVVQVFYGSAAGIGTTPSAVIEGVNAGDGLGSAVASAGDVNGDGYADLIVGADTGDKAQIYLGGAGGLATSPGAVLEGPTPEYDYFGRSIAGVGDVNGDGYADIVIGAPYTARMGLPRVGSASVFLGSSVGIARTPYLVLYGQAEDNNFGEAVASGGDLNGDGFGDFAIGAPNATPGGRQSAGVVSVFQGSRTGPSMMPSRIIEGGVNELFGGAISSGDLDADGYSDLAITAQAATTPTGTGEIRIFAGGSAGPVAVPRQRVQGPSMIFAFGLPMSATSDLNGDGMADLIVGVPFLSPSARTDAGGALIFAGQLAGMLSSSATVIEGPTSAERLGQSLAISGDINGDGISDFLLGSPLPITGGVVRVFHGSRGALRAVASTVLRGLPGDNFGAAIAARRVRRLGLRCAVDSRGRWTMRLLK